MRSEAGIGVVENLVAMSLLAIGIMGSVSLFTTCFSSNASARNFTSAVAEVHDLFDTYRGNYNGLLDEFGTSYADIANGQTASTSHTASDARSTFAITLTAISSNDESPPEAVRVLVSVAQRRGKIGDANFTFETIIAQTS